MVIAIVIGGAAGFMSLYIIHLLLKGIDSL